jgi:hypothetical protein
MDPCADGDDESDGKDASRRLIVSANLGQEAPREQNNLLLGLYMYTDLLYARWA